MQLQQYIVHIVHMRMAPLCNDLQVLHGEMKMAVKILIRQLFVRLVLFLAEKIYVVKNQNQMDHVLLFGRTQVRVDTAFRKSRVLVHIGGIASLTL